MVDRPPRTGIDRVAALTGAPAKAPFRVDEMQIGETPILEGARLRAPDRRLRHGCAWFMSPSLSRTHCPSLRSMAGREFGIRAVERACGGWRSQAPLEPQPLSPLLLSAIEI